MGEHSLYLAGLVFLALAKAKHTIQGYRTPKPFDVSQTERCVDYDARVVRDFVEYAGRYIGHDGKAAFADRDVLELGPGSDLGVGLEILAIGARSYHACDVNALASKVPQTLYDSVFRRLDDVYGKTATNRARDALKVHLDGARGALDYVARPDFDLVAAFGKGSIDLVVSNAAFEHFDDIEETIRDVTAVCRPGARMVVSVDLTTHSRWIHDKDPNNIYRYPDSLYRLFHFRGIPNRRRPYEYVQALQSCGWKDIRVDSVHSIDVTTRLAPRFRDPKNQMEMQTVAICATL